MKISKIKTMAAFTAAAMLLGGCGDAPYTLTESEEDIIVNYAAHVVAKFNTEQGHGLKYVNMDAEEEIEPAAETQDDTETPVSDTDAAVLPDGAAAGEVAAQTASLNDIFGTDSISVSYEGASLTPGYVENSYYAVDADEGKTFLVLTFAITNNGTEDAEFDNLVKMPSFGIETADGVKASSELSVLLEDFAAYQGTIPAGESRNAVLLFQIPDTAADTPEFTLSVMMGGTSYQIAL